MVADVIQVKEQDKEAKAAIVSDNNVILVTGKLLRIAVVHDEAWIEDNIAEKSSIFLEELKRKKIKADIFTFAQKIPDTTPHYNHHFEWDNLAAIPITTFEDWWENRLPQVTRKSIRRAAKRGVTASVVEFNDELVRGIMSIHNDTLTRQGTPFAHYGKSFDVVKKEYGTYLDRSEFIGAYLSNELIGIIKLVCIGQIASIMQIVSKTAHYDKRPTNVIIAKAVELCKARGIHFLVYGKYVYGNKTENTLTEFKRRNGFERVNFPRYYIPLTIKGRLAMFFKLHLGLLGILPNKLILFLLYLRTQFIQIKLKVLSTRSKSPHTNQIEMQ